MSVSLVSVINACRGQCDKFNRRELSALVQLLKIRMLTVRAGASPNYF
jgi:hypothetical protein